MSPWIGQDPSSVKDDAPILIIGAGLSGLLLARLLTNSGIPTIVFEASSATRSQGFSISLRDWGYDEILAALGDIPLSRLLRGVAPDRRRGGKGELDQVIRNNATGEVLIRPDPKTMKGIVRANREALRSWMADQGEEEVDVRYSHRLVEVSGEPGDVVAKFENGSVHRGCFLVGADGVHSAVRAQIIPQVIPETIPVVVYHGEFTLTHAEFDTLLRPLMGNGNILAGIGDDFNTPITMADVTSTHVHLDWSYSRNARIAGPDEDQTQIDPLYIPCSTRGFSSKSPTLPLDALAAELSTRSLAHPWSEVLSPERILSGDYKIVYWTSRCVTVSHKEEMTSAAKSSGVVFVGDAWHAMPIFGGEGGNHALVDAVELWEEIVTAREYSSEAGLSHQGVNSFWEIKAAEKYYSRAFARCQDAVRRSKQRFQVLHRPMSQWKEIQKKSEMMLKLMEKQQQGKEVTNPNDRDAAVAVSATA